MKTIVDFIGDRFDGWLTFTQATSTRCVLVLLLIVLVADIARRGWRLSWSRRLVEGVAATIAIFHVNMFFLPLVWLMSEEVKTVYALLGVPSIPTEFWAGCPVWALASLAILVTDFADYWNHRLMHLKWLWPIHAIHHSDPDVTGLTTYRVHALEMLVMWSSYTLILTWLGLPKDAIGIGAVLLFLHNVYVHVNIDWHHGPFRLLLASPRFHRWHHAEAPEAYGKNLANVFPFYDRLFGTYYVPGACTAPMGATDIPQNDVVWLMLWPFLAWGRLASAEMSALRQKVARYVVQREKVHLMPIDAEEAPPSSSKHWEYCPPSGNQTRAHPA